MRRYLDIRAVFCTVLVVLSLSVEAVAQEKRRVAVMDFDYATVKSAVSAEFGTTADIGKGIADLLVDRLVNGGVYSVIERKDLDKIVAEQNFSNSDRADANSAAKIGRILGVDAIIVGSITQFGRDDKSTGVAGTAVGGLASRYGLGSAGRRQSKAVVAISARLVNTSTGEIFSAATAKGESKRSGTTLLGSGGSSNDSATGGLNMHSSNFANTIIGEAVGEAVTAVVQQLQASAAKLPEKVLTVDGLVADATGDTLVLNIGGKAGVKVGDKLSVSRVGREIRDPGTGKVIRRMEDALGEVVITEVDELSAVGKFTGSAPAKVGDRVHN
jgi:curli biogenesis system outer membrane secretion channel CsgG